MQNMQKIIAVKSWGLYDQIRFLINTGLHNEVPSNASQMAAIQKSTNNKCWKGCREKETLLHCW